MERRQRILRKLWRHIRSLIRGALEMDDIDMLRKHLKETLATANRGITGY